MRRIGGKRALAPFFESYGVPANSDYHPYLDLHAARYRYLGESAGEFTAIGNAGVPVMQMLEGRDGSYRVEPVLQGEDHYERVFESRRARYALDFLPRGSAEPLLLSATCRRTSKSSACA